LREERRLKVFLRIGPKRDEEIGEWRKLHNEELNNLHPSPNIVRLMKSRRMRWAGVCSTHWERRGVYRVLMEKLWERDHLKDPGVDERIILRWISRNGMWGHGLD
jgi:hypothetical protein